MIFFWYLLAYLTYDKLGDMMKIGLNDSDLRMKYVKENLQQSYEVDPICKQYYDVIILNINEQIDINELKKENPNLKVIKHYYLDQEVKKINGICSAYGVLHYLLEHLEMFVTDYTYSVIGCGACGKAVYDLLKQLNCQVEMIRHHEVNEHDIKSDIIIYTAMKQVFSKKQIEQYQNKLIIDLSGCYQNNSIYLPRIPSKIAYQKSGEAISKYIREKINEKENIIWD